MFRALSAAPWFQKCLVLLVLSSPLAWEYLNEARPYAMQFGMSLVVFFSLYWLTARDGGNGRSRRRQPVKKAAAAITRQAEGCRG